jgi:hypothetical protein
LVLHVLSLGIWSRAVIRHCVERWVWYSVFFGIALMMSHRAADLVDDSCRNLFGSATGLLIAVAVLIATYRTFTTSRERIALETKLHTLTATLDTLQTELTARGHVAEELARVLNGLREEIDYYRAQAEAHQLPLYEE